MYCQAEVCQHTTIDRYSKFKAHLQFSLKKKTCDDYISPSPSKAFVQFSPHCKALLEQDVISLHFVYTSILMRSCEDLHRAFWHYRPPNYFQICVCMFEVREKICRQRGMHVIPMGNNCTGWEARQEGVTVIASREMTTVCVRSQAACCHQL